MSPRVALLAPFAFPSVRGNAITVARIAAGLRERNVDLRLWDLSDEPESHIAAEVAEYRPLLIHAFHAFRVGPLGVRLARRAEIPLVVTITGTDANYDLFDPERAPVVRRVLEGAARLTVFHASLGERILAALPDLRARLAVIPQSVRLEAGEPFDLRSRWPLPRERVLFVFPAGLRMVKNPRFPLPPLERLVARHPQVRLLYVGPVLDPEEGDALARALQSRSWARHVGSVPHRQMGSLLGLADVVLNCSLSEGGMANSILEAMAMGRAVLASDIDGNRSLVEDDVTGLLFRNEIEFEAQAERLASDGALRVRLGRAARGYVARTYPIAREIEGYLDVYRRLVRVPSV